MFKVSLTRQAGRNHDQRFFLKDRLNLLIFVMCVILLHSSYTCAQDNQNNDEVLSIDTALVQLNIGVVDKQGRPITSLTENNFAVYEDDVRQKILSFEPTHAPFSLVLLLDLSGSTLSFRSNLRQAALRFLDALLPEDRVSVITFNNKVQSLTGFTSNHKMLAYAIAERTNGGGETQLYKALAFSLEKLEQEGKRRKAIVVLTDGIDTSLRALDRKLVASTTTEADALNAIKPDADPTLNAVLNAADRQGVTIYPLALPSGSIKYIPVSTPQTVAMYTAARERIQLLARRTGGRLNEIEHLEDLGRLYAEVAADLRTLYSMVYKPAGDKPRDSKWRSIRIEVANSIIDATAQQLIARTRPGYYAR